MKFQAILVQLTSLSCPVFGVSWNPPEAEVSRARRILAFLEDRRVLYNPSSVEPGSGLAIKHVLDCKT